MKNNTINSLDETTEIHPLQENELASRVDRLGAALIDMLIILPITLSLMYFTGGFDGISEGVSPSTEYSLLISFVGIVFFIMIHGYLLIKNGQTIGKKVAGIKIVTLDNKLPTLSNLAKRYGFYWLIPLIPIIGQLINLISILFVFTKSKRCLHDHVGGTKVVLN
ncbi:RDD family protein [Thalassomonas sp. M1454]|uniref:RDD family protein n=1 Tax=Thalassomonas sp. M1454 TaxID=2594477 RepID=UPI00117F7583|nr:RDD family protein [Thalassomonas sp. M1454]TRX55659.1 RDD family protein [Thalassomonas sp. M1454]